MIMGQDESHDGLPTSLTAYLTCNTAWHRDWHSGMMPCCGFHRLDVSEARVRDQCSRANEMKEAADQFLGGVHNVLARSRPE